MKAPLPEVEPDKEPENRDSHVAVFELESTSLIPSTEEDDDQGADSPVGIELEASAFIFEPSGALHQRIAQYGQLAMRELAAREVAICDRDGLLLYRTIVSPGEEGLEAALLVAVSTKVTRFLGLEGTTATQVADGNGAWRCLISGAGEEVFAGFVVEKPLDYDEVETWTKALADAVNPAHRSA